MTPSCKWPISLVNSLATAALIDRLETRSRSTVNQGALRQRFFLAASPLVSSAFGRTLVGLWPTKRTSPSHARKNLWYLGGAVQIINYNRQKCSISITGSLPYKTCWKCTISTPRIIHVQHRNMNYYMKNRLFTFPYFSVRPTRSKTLRERLPS